MAINGSGLSGSRKTWPLFFFPSKIKVQIENMFNTSNLVQVPYVKRIFMPILFFISELKDRTSNTFFNYERSNPKTHHTTPLLACDGFEQVKACMELKLGKLLLPLIIWGDHLGFKFKEKTSTRKRFKHGFHGCCSRYVWFEEDKDIIS